MPFDLSLAECVRLNDDLQKAAKAKESPALIDIMTELKASDTKNKLKVRVRRAVPPRDSPFSPLPLLFFSLPLTAYMNKHTLACAVCGRFQARSDHRQAHQVSVGPGRCDTGWCGERARQATTGRSRRRRRRQRRT